MADKPTIKEQAKRRRATLEDLLEAQNRAMGVKKKSAPKTAAEKK